ncbi:MAG: hypothetical protein R3A10_09555 [Caldilineaceae bacterium]
MGRRTTGAVDPAGNTPGQPDRRRRLRHHDVFTTRNGSWERSDEPGAVPQWALTRI